MKKIILFFLFTTQNIFSQALIPNPPEVSAKSFLLMDAKTKTVITSNNPDESTGLASITKIMTSYVISDQISKGFISDDSMVEISEECWRMEGSRMFIKEGTEVSVSELLKGMIIQSGNDASCALAEKIAGSQSAFADLMNSYAEQLGLENTNFVNPTGLPDINHYSTANDIAKLSIRLIEDFPDNYALFKEKEYTFNNIRQLNRNSLLWQDDSIDGIKTGHTNDSGYCLVASAERDEMRLIAVTLDSTSEKTRLQDSRRLLDYGFRFFKTKKLLSSFQEISSVDVWAGTNEKVFVGPKEDIYLTLTKPQFKNLEMIVSKNLGTTAPIEKGDALDRLDIVINNDVIASFDLVALESINTEGYIWPYIESFAFYIYSFFMQDEVQ
ncbi:D-alanyl-D-alanine carboxypeptidase [Gammaproteobacteria bacterium]|nr:D-alanyl-D-alanine carboxypeptidase [Gammaproteobacteria bacterium]